MTDSLSKRNKANKRRGAQYETDLIAHLREQGYDAERTRLTGTADEGDLAIRVGDRFIIAEAKNTAKHNLSEFVAESELEAANYAKSRGKEVSSAIPIVVIKKRNSAISKSYVVMSLETLLRVIGI